MQRLVDPGQRVRVQRVDLAELRLQLPDLRQQAARQRREGQEPLLDLDALGRERRERSRRARTDRRPPGSVASASFSASAGIGSTVFLPAAPTKLPMTAMSG